MAIVVSRDGRFAKVHLTRSWMQRGQLMQLQMLTSFFGRDKLVRILLVDAYNMCYVPKKLKGVPPFEFYDGHGKRGLKIEVRL